MILDYAKDADEAVESGACLQRAFCGDAGAPHGRRRLRPIGIIEFIDGKVRVTPAKGLGKSAQRHSVEEIGDRARQFLPALPNRIRMRREAGPACLITPAARRRVARSMSVNNWTMWTSVYDLTTREARVIYKSRLDAEYRDEIPCTNGDEQTHAREPAARAGGKWKVIIAGPVRRNVNGFDLVERPRLGPFQSRQQRTQCRGLRTIVRCSNPTSPI